MNADQQTGEKRSRIVSEASDTRVQLAKTIKSAAAELGFGLCGITPATSPSGFSRLQSWLDGGFHGEMDYLQTRRYAYRHPQSVLPEVRSLVMLGLDYDTIPASPPQPGQARISRYAWGDSDYHDWIKSRLRKLESQVLENAPDAKVRTVVDTAPLLEREFAQMAGLGWFGKNTMLINPRRGSYFFLAALLTDLELIFDEPFVTDHCGTCTACLDACPTNAFPEPGVLDATRCISYLTIEHRGPISHELRAGIGDWLFGCDICQEVCPWNRHAVPTPEKPFHPAPGHNPVDVIELFYLSDEQWRARFRRTPLWRPKRRGLLRNAAIVLGNHPIGEAKEALIRGLHDSEPLVRGASAWAFGESAKANVWTRSFARNQLDHRADLESDEHVRNEIERALATL